MLPQIWPSQPVSRNACRQLKKCTRSRETGRVLQFSGDDRRAVFPTTSPAMFELAGAETGDIVNDYEQRSRALNPPFGGGWVTGRPSTACCKDARMRIDPDPGGSELPLLDQSLDNQRETVLLKSEGPPTEQVVQKLPPSDLTLDGGQNMPLAPGHHLLPLERWYASNTLERQRTRRNSGTPRNPATLRMEQNYGPEGLALLAAGQIMVQPGMLLGFLGFACSVACGGHPWLLTVLYWLWGIGLILMFWGSIRSFQASKAGRAFRGGRPFLKRVL